MRRQFDSPGFLIVGHRGAAGLEPENTLRGFRRALEIGVDAVELDVHLAHGTLLVIHDATLDRTTNGCGPLADQPLPALRQLDAGHGEPIPLLVEVMDLLDGHAGVNIELKGPGTAAALAASLREFPETAVAGMVVSSFDHSQLAHFHRLAPAVRTAPLFNRSDRRMYDVAAAVAAWSIHVSRRIVSSTLLAEIGARGYRSLVYTVNDPGTAARLRAAGATGIFTDYPDRMQPLRGPTTPTTP